MNWRFHGWRWTGSEKALGGGARAPDWELGGGSDSNEGDGKRRGDDGDASSNGSESSSGRNGGHGGR